MWTLGKTPNPTQPQFEHTEVALGVNVEAWDARLYGLPNFFIGDITYIAYYLHFVNLLV